MVVIMKKSVSGRDSSFKHLNVQDLKTSDLQ